MFSPEQAESEGSSSLVDGAAEAPAAANVIEVPQARWSQTEIALTLLQRKSSYADSGSFERGSTHARLVIPYISVAAPFHQEEEATEQLITTCRCRIASGPTFLVVGA